MDDDAGCGSSAAEPLVVDEHEGNVFIKGIGSEAKVLTADVATCGGGFVHLIDAVLLPIDGDGVLDEFQQRRVKAIRDRARAIAETRRAARTEDEDDVDAGSLEQRTAAAASRAFGDILTQKRRGQAVASGARWRDARASVGKER